MLKQKSFQLKPNLADKQWYLIDASELVVGRLATEIADLLRGKRKPTYTPNTDSGDFVVVVNAEKVRFTGKKLEDKNYYRHSGVIGNLKKRTAKEQFEIHPELVLQKAVKGMLPKSALGRNQLSKLKIFTGPEHTMDAQKPVEYKVRG